jgi:hypothetical protein
VPQPSVGQMIHFNGGVKNDVGLTTRLAGSWFRRWHGLSLFLVGQAPTRGRLLKPTTFRMVRHTQVFEQAETASSENAIFTNCSGAERASLSSVQCSADIDFLILFGRNYTINCQFIWYICYNTAVRVRKLCHISRLAHDVSQLSHAK